MGQPDNHAGEALSDANSRYFAINLGRLLLFKAYRSESMVGLSMWGFLRLVICRRQARA